MNLLFLNSIDRHTYGGMEEWIRLVASGLIGRGHEVTIAGRPNSEFLRRVGQLSSELSLIDLNISGDFNPIIIGKVRNLIRKNRIDIVLVNFNKDIRLGGLAAKLGGDVRVVWSVGLDITKNSFAHRHLTPRLIDGVIVPSQALKRQITRHGFIDPAGVEVIPIGIPFKESASRNQARSDICHQYGIDAHCKIVVTSGRCVDQKGHRYLIEAAAEIVRKCPSAVFLLLGDGPLRKELQSLASGLKLGNSFIFAGMLDNVDNALLAADLMVHPSIEEPFGIAVLEGMRASLAVVASRVGGISEVVEEDVSAILVDPKRPDLLAESVIGLLNDDSRRNLMGKNGCRRWKEKFQVEGMIVKIESYLMNQTESTKQYG